ncbi:uncharacterized protein LOC123684937 [Harmonia axyridis]|uniref:uncharacterized protein LOC123684937 n=1 Tax=Harmonia axyridis TaxID=115357 RepID=UPI001E277B0F|nr:uncharacterized protein LOC123684937 [Harmonia axyridis]
MIILVLLAVFPFNGAASFEKKSMIVKRSEYGDQKVSASGYTFQSNGDGPVEYSSYTLDNGNVQNGPFGYFGPHQNLRELRPYQIRSPYTYYNGDQTYGKFYQHVPNYYQRFHLGSGTPVEYSLPLFKNQLHNYGLHGGNYASINQNGRAFEGANNQIEGSKGEKGYKNQESYDNVAKGKHLVDKNQKQYSEKGGNKENDEENSGYNSQASESAKGIRGGSSGDSSRHRKGSKTTGFHKVYHKDEYKKDHSFYDEKDSSGHHDKYDSHDSKYAKGSGEFENGKKSKAGHREADYASKGYHDQGRYLDENDGRSKEQGNSAHFDNNETYAQKKEKEYQDENGYAVSDSD